MMPKEKTPSDDLFQRGRHVRATLSASDRDIRDEAGRAGSEDFLHGLVAAAAVIAHADGRLEMAERRKLVEAFLTTPALDGFSVAELAEELAEHMRAYAYDPLLAQEQALIGLASLKLSLPERQAIRETCHAVIMADGLVHPVELGALHRIEGVLGLIAPGPAGAERAFETRGS